MASNFAITGPSSVAYGATATYTVTCTLDPGTADQTWHLVLTDDDGATVLDQPVTALGRPTEVFPTIVLGPSAPANGYALALESAPATAVLAQLNSNTFTVRNV